MNTSVYPVRVDASLDQAHLNRWLWLLKWILVIPHYIVLAFLWLAFIVLSVVAGFAILFTGRYPQAIFEFNVGVLRWSWRVAYYAYGALGTDRYPPFTLAEVADYPAHLEVEYPGQLSRGLVLVKWWLLAIPHYLVVAFFVGGGVYVGYSATADATEPWVWSSGLIGLLVFIAAVVLLFTGRYPMQIFDLVLGLNRWVLRVAAYAALMTDEYPPFRLDLGGDDPGSGNVLAVPGGAPASGASGAGSPGAETPGTPAPGSTGVTGPERAAGAPVQPTSGRWSAGRVTAVVVGSIVLVLSAGLLLGGTVLAVAGQTSRDDDGFFMTDERTLETAGYAIASEPFRIDVGTAADDVPRAVLGDLKLEVTAAPGQEVFVGIAETGDAEGYLDGVAHSTLVDLEGFGARPTYRNTVGGAPAVTPAGADTWVDSTSGPGTQTLRWEIESGDWTVVVMNADASRDVTVDAAAGATVPAFGWLLAALFVAGALLLLVGLALVVGAVRSASRHVPEATATSGQGGPSA